MVDQVTPWIDGPASHLLEALERDVLLSLLEPRAGERFLEVGCGRGRRLALLRRRGLTVTGLESEAERVAAAQKHLGNPSLVHLGRPADLPFEDNAFEVVMLGLARTRALDLTAALAEAGRVARRRVVVEAVNPFSCLGLSLHLAGWDPVQKGISPWRLRRLAREVYGPSRVKLQTLITFPRAWLTWLKGVETSVLVQRMWLGGLVFLAVDLRYVVRTEPLAAPAKPARATPDCGPLTRIFHEDRQKGKVVGR
jgi:SAM-dependent methyltransferase